MKKVTPKGAGLKLKGKWCFFGQEEIISEEEYNVNKEYLIVLEDIKETSERVIEIVVKDDTIDIEALKRDLEKYVENYNNPKEDPGANTDEDRGVDLGVNPGEDEELKSLKEKAKKLGIKNTHNMKKETLIEKITEKEKE